MSLTTTLVLGALGFALGMAIARARGRIHLSILRSRRLGGLTILAVYELFVGVILSIGALLTIYAVVTRHDELRPKLVAMGSSPMELVCDLAIASTLALFAGYGLWFRTHWSWSATVFVMGLSAARNALCLFGPHKLIAQMGVSELFFVPQHSIRTVIPVVALIYLFRTSVMRYCGVDSIRHRHLAKLCGGIVAGIGLEILFG